MAMRAIMPSISSFFKPSPPYSAIPHLQGDLLPYVKGDQLIPNLSIAAKLGGMSTFRFGSRIMILLNHPDLIYDYKVRCQPQYTRSVYDYNNALLGYAVATQDTSAFRKTLFSMYHHDSFETIKRTIATVTQKNISELSESMTIEDVSTYSRLFALELAMKCFMGVDVDTTLSNKTELAGFLSEILLGPNTQDLGLRFLNLIEGEKSNLSSAELTAIEKFNANARDKLFRLLIKPYGVMEQQDTILEHIWRLSSKAHKEDELTYASLYPDALLMLIGGEVTSLGDSLSIVLKLLAEHKDVYDKLVCLLQKDQEAGLTYLEQIIKESFRLYPPVAVMPAAMVEKPFSLGGITINAGHYVLVSPHLIHRHPDYWPDPDDFNPDRFADNDKKIKRGSYLAFGLGAKFCPGQRYAMEVLKTFLAELLLNFDIALQSTSTLQQVGPTVVTTDKMPIALTKREQTASMAVTFKR